MNNQPVSRVFKAIGFFVTAFLLLQLSGGCGALFPDETTNDKIKDTLITDLKITPPSGKAEFELLVTYKFADSGKGRASIINCSYIRPDGVASDIGEIRPSPDSPGWILDNSGMISNYRALHFTVETSYGPPKPGPYKVRCQTELGYHVEAPFTVEGDEARANPPAPEVVPAETEVTEVVITPTPLPVVKLTEEMFATDVDPPIHATWGGKITINPDGSVREKLSGEIVSSTAYSIAGVHAGTYQVHITFNVDLAGSAELTPNGMKMKVQQTVADSHLDPITVTEGSLDADAMSRITKGIQEAFPNWLNKIVTGLEFEGASLPLTQEVVVGAWKGTATLSQGK